MTSQHSALNSFEPQTKHRASCLYQIIILMFGKTPGSKAVWGRNGEGGRKNGRAGGHVKFYPYGKGGRKRF